MTDGMELLGDNADKLGSAELLRMSFLRFMDEWRIWDILGGNNSDACFSMPGQPPAVRSLPLR
jgi:hypothetical protein